MDGSFFNNHHLYSGEQEDSDKTPESPPPSTAFSSDQSKHSPTAAANKKGRRGMKKKVVSVRINGETPRSNTGSTTPPSDSWAWRKYGQKPIKGSPYPRAYYRCSSSKGCPARKQVERNRLDPTMLVITYSCEHNHSGPVSRNNNHHHSSAVSKPSSPETLQVQPVAEPEPEPEPEPEEQFVDMGDDSLITGDEFSWFGEMETTSSTVLESSIFSERSTLGDSSDVTMLFPMGDDEESLFADLGELPECSVVFRQGGGRGVGVGVEEQPAQRRITPWCGTTS